MLAPNAKTREAHAAQRQHHQALHPDGLARKRRNQMSGEAETGKHGDIDFGLREKPEEAPPKHGQSVRHNVWRQAGEEVQRRKKVRAQETIRKQADARCQQNAENQHS